MVNDFKTKGYSLLNIENKAVFDAFNEALKALIKYYCSLEDINVEDDEVFHKGFILLDQKNHDHIHEMYNTLRNSNVIYDIVTLPEIAEAVKTLLSMDPNDPLYYFFHVCRMDPPGDEKFILKWHQEDYSLDMKASSIRLWAPLVERTGPENGSIDVLIGSHQDGELPHYILESDGYNSLYIPEEDIDFSKYGRMTVEMEPGQVLLLDPDLIHKSNYNPGTKVRYSLTVHIMNPKHEAFRLVSKEDRFRMSRMNAVNYDDYKSSLNAASSY